MRPIHSLHPKCTRFCVSHSVRRLCVQPHQKRTKLITMRCPRYPFKSTPEWLVHNETAIGCRKSGTLFFSNSCHVVLLVSSSSSSPDSLTTPAHGKRVHSDDHLMHVYAHPNHIVLFCVRNSRDLHLQNWQKFCGK